MLRFLERERVPVHQNLPRPSQEDARATARGDLALYRCPSCALVANLAFRSELLAYGEDYDNNQSMSGVFDEHVTSLLDELVRDGISGKQIIEVGCGKGYFLERLCELGQNTGVGYDATYEGPSSKLDGRVRFVRDFYGGQASAQNVDVIVCRHVIEHVPRPVDFLKSIRDALSGSKDTVLYFETPALEWIIDGAVFWDFFYEHCCYFTEPALRNMFRLAGFETVELRRVFKGQYLWLKARYDARNAPLPLEPGATDLEAYRVLEQEKIKSWQHSMRAYRASGPVAVWGAGAKGVTFVNLLDPTGELVDCIVDINPNKQGQYVPGSGHLIVEPAALGTRGIRNVILMNPNYTEEVRQTLQNLGLEIGLHAAE
jgi:SAM-dependent methyltransferase